MLEKRVHMVMSKKLQFDQTIKCYMNNLESVLEKEMHKVLGNFAIQTDHLISVRRLGLQRVTKQKKKEKRKREPVD